MAVEFIPAKQEDLPAIVAIYNQNITSKSVTADLQPVSVDQRQEWFNDHNKKRPLWIIEVNNQLAGWLSLESFYGRAAYHATVEISIYLDRKFQHQGLGTKALAYAAAQTKQLEINTILAYIFGTNKASQALFKAAGYQVYGHLPKVADMDGRLIDLDILGKKFG
ncbi:GNAT family N-acetyltransferase [Lactobacillus sp. ESL0703]|uniref:GNAT family N-acetyltransferase n=1 Tax=Lactobacillus sp. ESL0703 TaxID=2983218 RepID=UPI0023F8871A|nr:GNAT family N-acetyltransferase [Lactobacillus sp. ESL0703]MDF7669213.1 GNAT family N-acetyltransferase [Lactobacillus sp. ESL0703]